MERRNFMKDWSWAVGYAVGGILGSMFVHMGIGVYESIAAIVIGALACVLLEYAGGS